MNPKPLSLESIAFYASLAFFLAIAFSTALAEAIAVILLFTWSVRSLQSKNLGVNGKLLPALVFAFVGFRILSIFLSVDLVASQKGWEKVWIPLVFFPAATLNLNKDKAKLLLGTLVVGAILASLIGSYKVLAGIEMRAASTSGGYYTLGTHVALVTAILLAFVPKRGVRLYSYPGLLLLISGVFFTYTRACYLAILATLAVVTFVKDRLAMLLVVPFVLLYLVLPLGRFAAPGESLIRNLTTGRVEIWEAGVRNLERMPIWGYGINTFKRIYAQHQVLPDSDPNVNSWHSDSLQIILESGPFVLAAYLGIVLLALKGACRLWRKSQDPLASGLGLGTLLFLGNWMIIGGFAYLLGDPMNSLFFWFFIGLSQGVEGGTMND